MIKKLLLLFLLPAWVHAQTVTLNKNTTTGILKTVGSVGGDTVVIAPYLRTALLGFIQNGTSPTNQNFNLGTGYGRSTRLGIGVAPLYSFHIEQSVASSIIATIRNSSSTGSGLEIAAGDVSHTALNIADYTNGANNFMLYGNGKIFSRDSIRAQSGMTAASFTNNGSTSGAVTHKSITGTYTWIDPPTMGTNGYILSTDGTSQTSWIPAPSGGFTDSTTAGTGLANKNFVNQTASTKISNTGQPKAIQYFNDSGTATQDSTKLKFKQGTGSLYVGVNSSTIPAQTIYFFGDSYTVGIGATSNYYRFSTVLSRLLGQTENNNGVSGSTMEKRSPVDYGGALAVNMQDRLSSIPTYVAGTTKWLVTLYGINDWRYDGGSYSSTNFQTDYTSYLTYATATKGWPANRIVVTSLPYLDPANYSTVAAAGTPNQTTMDAFNAATLAVSASFGTKYADIYNVMKNHGGAILITTDKLHPNNIGHNTIALAIANAIVDPVTIDGQAIAANGTVEFSDIKLKNYNLLSETSGYNLGIDSTGKLGLVNTVRDNTRQLGTQIFAGNVIQQGVGALTPTLGTYDWKYRQNTKLYGVYDSSPGFYNYITMINNSAGMDFFGSYSQSKFNFFTNSTQAFSINQNGQILVGNAPSIIGTQGGDIFTVLGGALAATVAGAYGRFEPLDGSFGTSLRNSYTTGTIGFYTSGGTTASQVQQFKMFAGGRSQFQNGGTYTDIPTSLFSLNSTTLGWLMPRMTTAQFAAISSKATGLESFDTTTGRPTIYDGANVRQVAYTTDIANGSYSTTGTATTTFTVTIGVTEPNTTYKVQITPTALVSAAVFYVTNKTTTTFDVVYLTGLTGAVSFDWGVFQ